MFTVILALILAALAVTVIASITEHRASACIAAALAWGLTLQFVLAQLAALVWSTWASWLSWFHA